MSKWSLGLVRKSLGTSSGGVGLVRSCQFGLWDETWDFFASYQFRRTISCGVEDCIPLWRSDERPNVIWSHDAIAQTR
jgi:hypothetical protein